MASVKRPFKPSVAIIEVYLPIIHDRELLVTLVFVKYWFFVRSKSLNLATIVVRLRLLLGVNTG